MAIFVNESTKVIVQGLTGGQGKFHGLRNRDYGTQVVAGVTPGKGGQDVAASDGARIPIFDTVAEAVAATGATASFVAVPPKAAPAAILEAASAGIGFVVWRSAEHLPDEAEGDGRRLYLDDPATRADLRWVDLTVPRPPVEHRPDHLAYVIFTSGSTGRPKGVETPYQGLVNMLVNHRAEIFGAIEQHLSNGTYEPDPIYGDGHAGERIADLLATAPLTIEKRLTY